VKRDGGDARERLIEAFGTIGESMGLNRSVCQMYALLYLTGESLSPSDIGRALGISKGNVSINMRKLEEWGAVKRVWRKGCARALYRADENIEEIIVGKIKTGLGKRLDQLKTAVGGPSGKRPVRGARGGAGKPERVERLARLVERAGFFVENLDHMAALLKDD